MKKPVSLHGTGPFAPIPSSDTDFCSENGVSRSEANLRVEQNYLMLS
jgi:hypothetical protein